MCVVSLSTYSNYTENRRASRSASHLDVAFVRRMIHAYVGHHSRVAVTTTSVLALRLSARARAHADNKGGRRLFSPTATQIHG